VGSTGALVGFRARVWQARVRGATARAVRVVATECVTFRARLAREAFVALARDNAARVIAGSVHIAGSWQTLAVGLTARAFFVRSRGAHTRRRAILVHLTDFLAADNERTRVVGASSHAVWLPAAGGITAIAEITG